MGEKTLQQDLKEFEMNWRKDVVTQIRELDSKVDDLSKISVKQESTLENIEHSLSSISDFNNKLDRYHEELTKTKTIADANRKTIDDWKNFKRNVWIAVIGISFSVIVSVVTVVWSARGYVADIENLKEKIGTNNEQEQE